MEQEGDAERRAADQRLSGLRKRLDEENKKIDAMMNSPDTGMPDIEISQSVVNMLQKQILAERTKLAALGPKKTTNKQPKSTKPKKSGAAAGGSTGGKGTQRQSLAPWLSLSNKGRRSAREARRSTQRRRTTVQIRCLLETSNIRALSQYTF